MAEPGNETAKEAVPVEKEPEKDTVSDTIATLKAAAADLKTSNGNGTSSSGDKTEKPEETEKPEKQEKPVTNGSAAASSNGGNSEEDEVPDKQQKNGGKNGNHSSSSILDIANKVTANGDNSEEDEDMDDSDMEGGEEEEDVQMVNSGKSSVMTSSNPSPLPGTSGSKQLSKQHHNIVNIGEDDDDVEGGEDSDDDMLGGDDEGGEGEEDDDDDVVEEIGDDDDDDEIEEVGEVNVSSRRDNDVEEVQDVSDSDSNDSDVLAVDESSKGSNSNSSGPAKKSGSNVVTIDNPSVLRSLANDAKAKASAKHVNDRSQQSKTINSILNASHSGVTITPTSSSSVSSINRQSSFPKLPLPPGLSITSGNNSTSRQSQSPQQNYSSVLNRLQSNRQGSNNSTPTHNSTVNPYGSQYPSPKSANAQATPPPAPIVAAPPKQPELQDPNLTDDTFVVEAPSFIVPYVYEKPPKETIKDFKKAVGDIVDKKKKEEEEKEKKEKDADSGKESDSEEKDDQDKKEKKDEDNKEDKSGDQEKKEPEDPDAKKAEEQVKRATEEKKEKEKPKTYFESVLGKFIMDLGMNLVQENVQNDLLRDQTRRSHKDKSAAIMHSIMSLKKNIESSKEKNADFAFDLIKCKFCSFKTESETVMENHLESPHVTKHGTVRCNFCKFEEKVAMDVANHMMQEHGVKGRLERLPAIHQCPQCPYEDHQKGKLTRHKVGCDKRYRPERNMEPPHDFEPPAKVPKPVANPMLPRTGLRPNVIAGAAGAGLMATGMNAAQTAQTAQNRQALLAAAAAQQRVAGMPQLQFGPRGAQAMGIGNRAAAAAAQQMQRQGMNFMGRNNQASLAAQQAALRNQQAVLQAMNASQGQVSNLLPNLGRNSSVTIQSIGQRNNSRSSQPSISITPLPGARQGSPAAGAAGNTLRQGGAGRVPNPAPANSNASSSLKPGQPGGSGMKNVVVCEICDGYIRDLEQLRNHMQWIHKVKIHPKMIYNRPPLNCQKCQYRFFTDQGLERHLLGSHGLVTASMQDLANKSQDSGRCPVCGKVYQWKLLNHVAKDHGKVLKPAHLSYKCTVCTATFGQYKLFENHVYTAHSGGNRKGVNKPPPSSSGSSKAPIKVSDEITIIPAKAASASNAAAPSASGDKAKATTPKTKPGSDDIIELDDDEEEIDEEMKESGESAGEKSSSPATAKATAKRPAPEAAEKSDAKESEDDDEPAGKRPKSAEAEPANGDKSDSKTDHEVSGDEEGVEEIQDEDDD